MTNWVNELSKKILRPKFFNWEKYSKKNYKFNKFKNKDIVEIGPGKGALTDEIVKAKPKSITLIEKDYNLSQVLFNKYKLKEYCNCE